MENLINNIKENSILSIQGDKYEVQAKAHYVTESNPKGKYVKVFCDNHFVLVISPGDDLIYFGKDVGSINDTFPSPKELTYEGKKYSLAAEDYQILTYLEFGSPINTEGEVRFIDYECGEDQSALISVGLVVRNKKRADVVANILDIDDIVIV